MNTDPSPNNELKIKKWITADEKELLTTPVFSIHSHIASLESLKKSGTFYTIKAPDWINIIALTPQKNIVLVEQYRFGNRQISIEIPGGMVDATDNDPLETAKRELVEETGYESNNWVKLGKVSVNPALFTNYCHLYLALDCRLKGTQKPDEHEVIRVLDIPFNDFLKMVKEEKIDHSLVVAAVSHYLLWEKLS